MAISHNIEGLFSVQSVRLELGLGQGEGWVFSCDVMVRLNGWNLHGVRRTRTCVLFAFTLFRNDNVIQASRLSAAIKSIKAASVNEL